MIGTAERCINCCIRLSVAPIETVPVVRAVLGHRQQIPGNPRHFIIEVGYQRLAGIVADSVLVAIYQSRDSRERRSPSLECFDKTHQRVKSFTRCDEIRGFFRQGSLGQSGNVPPEKKNGLVRRLGLDRGTDLTRCGHDLR